VIRLVEFSWILSSKTRFSEVYRPAERCGLLGHLEKNLFGRGRQAQMSRKTVPDDRSCDMEASMTTRWRREAQLGWGPIVDIRLRPSPVLPPGESV